MRARIESDGRGTRVYDVETGREIKCLAGLRWSHRVDDIARAEAELAFVEGTMEGRLVFMLPDPLGESHLLKRVRRVEFEDGSVFEPK